MATVLRSLGGAGTGKTRQILGNLSQAKAELGLSVEQIGFCTFTRAGRAELTERAAAEWGVDTETLSKAWFRTAHSIAHKCTRVEDGQLIQGADGDKWLAAALGGSVGVRVDPRGERTYVSVGGDDTIALSLKAWDLARARMCSLETVFRRWDLSGEVRPDIVDAAQVVEKYELAKRKDGRLDFTDMIARFAGVRYTVDGPVACTPEGDVPADLRVLAIDEAQDSSPLVDMVCRRIAASDTVDRIWLCGDPYQSIHSFAGGDFRLFLAWDAVESIMPRSYRCPSRILDLGEACLRDMRDGYRDRGISPAKEGGSVDRAETAEDAIAKIDKDSTVLILGRCAFSLERYEEHLEQSGVPYAWVDKTNGSAALSGYTALWSLQHGEPVSGHDWGHAVSIMSVKDKEVGEILYRGEKSAWGDGRRSHVDIVVPEDSYYEQAGAAPRLRQLIRAGEWIRAIEPKHRQKAARWFREATAHGPEAASNPKIRLSTIHSAKGLEADIVIMSSITSSAVERGRTALRDIHDEECRVAYVGVTRAKRDFIYVDDGTHSKMTIPI